MTKIILALLLSSTAALADGLNLTCVEVGQPPPLTVCTTSLSSPPRAPVIAKENRFFNFRKSQDIEDRRAWSGPGGEPIFLAAPSGLSLSKLQSVPMAGEFKITCIQQGDAVECAQPDGSVKRVQTIDPEQVVQSFPVKP